MGLEDLVKEENPRKIEGHCPECGTKGEDTEHWYYRCTLPTDECPVLTWIE